MPATYNTTPLDATEKSAIEHMVEQMGVVALCAAIPCKPDTLRRARAGEGLREHVLDRFKSLLHPYLDAKGLTPSERRTLVALVERRTNFLGETKAAACGKLAAFLQATAASR